MTVGRRFILLNPENKIRTYCSMTMLTEEHALERLESTDGDKLRVFEIIERQVGTRKAIV